MPMRKAKKINFREPFAEFYSRPAFLYGRLFFFNFLLRFPMWSKDEAAKLKQAFWIAFGHYMRPVTGANGEPQKWLNYATGIPDLYFRTFAGRNSAAVGIEIADAESGWGRQLAAQLTALQGILKASAGEDWHWIAAEERAPQSRLFGTELQNVSVYRQEDWPALISFFKPRLLALDAFWQEARWGFEALL